MGSGRRPVARTPETSEDTSRRKRLKVTRPAIAAVTIAIVIGLLVGADNLPTTPSAEIANSAIDVASFPTGALAGQPAPEVILSLFEGSEFVLSEHFADDGRPLVLNLWASWCIPCRREIPEFSRAAEANPAVAFVGAAVEDAYEPAEAFAAEVGAGYPMGIDERLTVEDGYPFVGLPATYLIGSDGNVVRQIHGLLDAAALQAFIDHDFGT